MIRAWAPLKILSFARNASREVEKSGIRFDVVHAMTQTYPSDLYWNGGGLQINWIPARYGEDALKTAWLNPRHAANLFVEGRIFEPGNYRRIVALTHMEREQILSSYGVPEDRFHVIPNGVDPDRFNPEVRKRLREDVRGELDLKPEETMILVVGTDGVRKGFPQLFEALSWLESPRNWRVVIAGGDPPRRWMPQVRKRGLDEKVRFHGREPRIERLYAAADLLVMASLFEGYGNVIPEAMACGCPVLTTRRVGAADFVEPGRTGWVLDDCRNRNQYTAALAEALYDADLVKMGEAAAERIRPCTWEWTVDRLEQVYRMIAAEKRSL